MDKCWSGGPNITLTAEDYIEEDYLHTDLNPEEKQRIVEAGKNQQKPSEKEEVESQHKFWKDRNPPQCLHCGKTEQELAKESTTNLQKIDNQLVDSPTKELTCSIHNRILIGKSKCVDCENAGKLKQPPFSEVKKMSATKVDKENTIDSDIDFTSKFPMFKALEKAFMNSYCQHQKKNNEACSDCGRMILKAK